MLPAIEHLKVERHGAIFIIILQKPPENRLTMSLCQGLIDAYRYIEKRLSELPEPEGVVILRGQDEKFFTTVGKFSFETHVHGLFLP